MDDTPITLFTPVAARDADRCELLLESLASCATTFRHVVVVDTEDMGTAGARLRAHSPHVEVVSTADVLDERTELRRHRPNARKRLGYWTGAQWRYEPMIYNWHLQQVLKLSFAATDRSAAVVCVDSDLVALRPLRADDFLVGGVPLLLEAPEMDGESASWELAALRFLGVPLQGTPVLRHTFEPAVLAPDAVREIVSHLGGERWVGRFLRSGLTEYSLHGAWRRFRSSLPLRTARPDGLVRSIRFAGDVAGWEASLAEALSADTAFFHAQSTLGLELADIRAAIALT